MDERVVDRWMAVEMTGLAQSIVAAARPVGDLLPEEAPAATTRGGDPHAFDVAALRALAERLSPLERRRVRVPVTFWVDKDVAHDAFVQDAGGMDALRALAVVPRDREARGGKLWVSLAIARETSRKYPTLFQFVHF